MGLDSPGSFSLLLHAYPRPSKNSPYARSKNCVYHRYIYSLKAKLDYCNSLFLNINITQINRFQLMQNAHASAVTKTPKHHHITPVLKKLHWLKIPERIKYNAISLTYST